MKELGRKTHLNNTLVLSIVEIEDLKMKPKCKICSNDDELFYVFKQGMLSNLGFHICIDCLNIIADVQEMTLD